MTMRGSHLCLITTGSITLALAITLAWLGIPKLIDSQIKGNVKLVEGSDTWKSWSNVSVPINLKFFLYNVTNPEEIENGGKPRVSEMGPYTYREQRVKVDLHADLEKDTVSYRQPITYFFDRNNSYGEESDKITVLNMVFVGFVELGHKLTQDEFLLTTLDEMISSKGEKLFRTQTVRELLFDGFSIQNVLELLNDPIVQSAVGEVKLPTAFANGKFGLFEGKNGSDEGLFEVKSGTTNYTEFGQIVSWNNKSELSWWKDSCNSIAGTDGSMFQPFLTKKSRLNLFAPDLCRSMYVTFSDETTYEGVHGYRFTLAKELLKNSETNPDNKCFCTAPENETSIACKTNGMMSLASCREGSPIWASSPHFFGADPETISAIDGISPSAEKHETFLDLEPRSGLLLRTAKRLQFSMKLKQYDYMPTFEKVRTVVFPLVWVEESAELVGKNLETLQTLTTVNKVVGIGKWIVIGIGAIVLAAGVILASLRKAEIIPK